MTDAERLKRYDDLLTAYFPPDFKDWHQNSRDEWPEITVMALRRRDNEIARLEKYIEADERQIKRQAETIKAQGERMREAHRLIASVYRPEWTREHEALEQAKQILAQKTDKPAIKEETR